MDKQKIIIDGFLNGKSQWGIHRETGISRKTIRKYIREYEEKRSKLLEGEGDKLYFIFIKCVLCEAVGSADQNHKTFKTFLFFTRKKKQKNLPSATSAKGGFALVLV